MRRLWTVLIAALFLVSCANREPEKIFVHVPCAYIELPPKPTLPIQGYQPTWTKDQLLQAYAESALLLEQWRRECAAIVQAHNARAREPTTPKAK